CTRRPSVPLRPFIENFWFHEAITTSHSMERLLPDGAIELIIDLTESPKSWRDSATPLRMRTVRGSWISGQHSRHIDIAGAVDSRMIGARFRPGGLYPFLGAPVAELNDSVVEAELLWGIEMRDLREALLSATSVGKRFGVLDRWLFARAGAKLEPDPCLSRVLDRLVSFPGETLIRALADECGLTQKRLVRTFEDKVGLRPKTLARILRFQTVLKKLERESRVSWSFVAQEAGYYDQAHFIRDFETFSGLTPSRYLVERGEFLNFIPLR
ncbi:MAG: AraC family transcriptional regulator, partial [Vicinamibacteria bacterium]